MFLSISFTHLTVFFFSFCKTVPSSSDCKNSMSLDLSFSFSNENWGYPGQI